MTQKKEKRIDWNTSFNKKVYEKSHEENESNKSYLNQSTFEKSPLIHGQINLIKFVKLKKFDNV